MTAISTLDDLIELEDLSERLEYVSEESDYFQESKAYLDSQVSFLEKAFSKAKQKEIGLVLVMPPSF